MCVCRIFVAINNERTYTFIVLYMQRHVLLFCKVIGTKMSYQRAIKRPHTVIPAASYVEHVNICVKPAHHVLVCRRKVVLTFAHNVSVITILFIFIGTTKFRVHQTQIVPKLVTMCALLWN